MNFSDLLARPFGWGSAIRGKRFFHPIGVLAEGAVERIAPADDGLPIPSSDVVARLSKATGTPGALPDFIGLAVRVPADAKQWDILLVSAGSGLLGRTLTLRPVTSWTGQHMSTLMPVRYGGKLWWLQARITTEIPGPGVSLDAVRERIEQGGIEVVFDQACGRSDFEPVARVTLTSVLDERRGKDVSFDPVINTAPGLELYPEWLADLRARAYRHSREGRDAS
ncbi:phosphodiesterase [Mycobacterium sp. 1164966.3]|uniref:phosphodiesterase n=1 Tax=Mycobacterium sp. 1164966.3 TaxID=1856861 RepID=UPI0007FF0E9D|nr:phosphodiesterase [Mycobacterium sp. 1164966.3]OBA79935.1 phosphodiesterase [Mycobacterium sp. 1164966.3]